MKSIKSLLVLGAMAMASSMAWAQTDGAGSITSLPTDENSKQAYQLVSARGTLYYDANVEAECLTSNCYTGRNWNAGVHSVDVTNEGGQFLLFPGTSEHGFYVYNVAKKQFIYRTTADGEDGNVRAKFTDTPTEVFIWAHGQTGAGDVDYAGAGQPAWQKSDYGFTIAYAYNANPSGTNKINSINVCCWQSSNPDYRWSNTSGYDGGNCFAIVPAATVSDEVWQDAYDKIHPSAPVDPYVFTTEIKNKNTYAIVNVQPAGSHNWYLKNVEGVLTPTNATDCNAATEWEEDAQFVAEVQADGRVAFKNVANGQYFAWKGTGTANNNTVGVNNNSGFDTVLGDHTLWTLHNDTRFEDTYYLVANKRAPEGTAYNKAGSPIIANNGAWNAWGDTNCTLDGYSTSFGFVLVKEYVEPIFTTDKLYTLKNEKNQRGYLAMNPDVNYVGLADVALNPYVSLHASSSDNGVSIAWQLEENGEGQVALRNVINGKYLGKGAVVDGQGGVWSDTPLYFTYEAAEDAGAYHLKVGDLYLCPACGWSATQGAVRFQNNHEDACDLVIAETESVPVHVGEAGFATLYVDKDVAAPFGVTAYLLSDCGTYLAAKDAPSFQAETGVVLEAAEGDYLFPVVPNAGVNNSDLTGTLVEMAAPADCLVLGKEDGEVGFYSFTGTLAANKAYFVKPAASNLRISFSELTSIISAAQQNGGQAIFDLQGRRVVKAQNGLFIQNGKKVIR